MTPKTTFIQMDDNASIEEKIEALMRTEGEVTFKGIKSTLENKTPEGVYKKV